MKKQDLDEHQAILNETRDVLQQEINADASFDSVYIESWVAGDTDDSVVTEDIEALAEALKRHHSEYVDSRQ